MQLKMAMLEIGKKVTEFELEMKVELEMKAGPEMRRAIMHLENVSPVTTNCEPESIFLL